MLLSDRDDVLVAEKVPAHRDDRVFWVFPADLAAEARRCAHSGNNDLRNDSADPSITV